MGLMAMTGQLLQGPGAGQKAQLLVVQVRAARQFLRAVKAALLFTAQALLGLHDALGGFQL